MTLPSATTASPQPPASAAQAHSIPRRAQATHAGQSARSCCTIADTDSSALSSHAASLLPATEERDCLLAVVTAARAVLRTSAVHWAQDFA